jgi:CMP/dCMP kinase
LKNIIIAIDGPAGSGKQRIAKYIAKKYKYFHLDSGILYRRLAYLLIKNRISENNHNSVKEFIKSLKVLSHRNNIILRKENVSKASSLIAIHPFIRHFINKQQKMIIKKMLNHRKGCVIDGRDIGSKVFKEAKIKLFIEVNIKIRAKRRHKQLIELGEKSIYSQILKEIKLRDNIDKSRKYSPLIKAKGAIIIDNSFDFKNTKKLINCVLKKL